MNQRPESAILRTRPAAWTRFARHRGAMAGAIMLLLLAAAALLTPLISPFSYDEVLWDRIGQSPDIASGHIMGTDFVGRDVFVRTMLGLAVSLVVGLSAAAVSVLIGAAYGAIAGYAGGATEQIMMRIVDGLFAIPFMFVVILVMVVFGRNFFLLFVAIAAIQWLTMARITCAQTRILRQRGFIIAAELAGLHPALVILRHIAPNLGGLIVIYLTLTIPEIILIESFLSFLGMGVQEPLTSLGVLISDGAKEIYTAPWLLAAPVVTLTTCLISLNLIGDGLRSALDPKDASP